MRIGFSKKIMGVRVSSSKNISGGKIIKGLGALLLLPFYISYYVCIWPFVKLFQLVSRARVKKIRDPAFLRHLQIFDESVNICMSTSVPATYFGRYKDAENAAFAMAAMTNKAIVHGETPQETVEMLQRDKTKSTNAFLDKYASDIRQKAFSLTRDRKKRLESFLLITSEFESEMTRESIEYRDKLYSEMLESSKKLRKNKGLPLWRWASLIVSVSESDTGRMYER